MTGGNVMRRLLINARKESGLTVKEIAKKLKISTSFYYKIEGELRNPTLILAKKIANILDRDVEELFFNELMDE